MFEIMENLFFFFLQKHIILENLFLVMQSKNCVTVTDSHERDKSYPSNSILMSVSTATCYYAKCVSDNG